MKLQKMAPAHRAFVLKFHAFLQRSYRGGPTNRLHVIAELIYFLMGGAKAFSLYFGKDGDFSKDALIDCFELLFELTHMNETDFMLEKLDDYYYLTWKRHKADYDQYKKTRKLLGKKGYATAGADYGNLMGYPKTATAAWGLECGAELGKRNFLLEYYTCQLIWNVYGDFFVINFTYSKKYWQEEYKAQVKMHLRIYAAFPEIFSKFFSMTKNDVPISYTKAALRKKDLFKALTPMQKATFLACESRLLTEKEKNALVY